MKIKMGCVSLPQLHSQKRRPFLLHYLFLFQSFFWFSVILSCLSSDIKFFNSVQLWSIRKKCFLNQNFFSFSPFRFTCINLIRFMSTKKMEGERESFHQKFLSTVAVPMLPLTQVKGMVCIRQNENKLHFIRNANRGLYHEGLEITYFVAYLMA